MIYRIKRYLYLKLKPMVNAFKPLKYLNKLRRQSMSNAKREAVSLYGLSTAVDVTSVLEKEGFEPVLVFGSLLGAIREGRFIRNDNDLDFGIEVDSNADWQRVRNCMEEAGYKIARQYRYKGLITEQAYYSHGFTFDIWGLMPIEDSTERRAYYHCIIDTGEYSTDNDRSVKCIDLPAIGKRVYVDVEGASLPVPDNAEECLTRAYTDHWRIPDPTWVSGTDGGWKLLEGVVERREVF